VVGGIAAGWPLVAGRGRGMAWNGVAPLEAAVVVLVLIPVDTVCVGGVKFVGAL
jgi:hypothetical protein